MSLRFGIARAVNFGPFEDATFDLSLPGLTLVEGEMQGIPGCNSNGTGKSFMLETIAWGSYGRCLRADYSGNDIVRHTAKGGTMVEVNIIGDVTAQIRRYRGHPVHKDKLMLFVAGKDVTAGTNPQTQDLVEKLLGYDFTGFTTTTAFGAREDVKSFFAATDTDRKRLLDSVLRLDRFDAAQTAAVAAAKAVGDQQRNLETRVLQMRAKCEGILSAAGPEVDETELNGLRVRGKLAHRQLATAQQYRTAALEDALRAREAHAEAEAAHYDACKQANAARTAAMEKRGMLDAQVTTAQRDVHKAATAVRAATQELGEVDELIGKPCEACGQEVTLECLAPARNAREAAQAEARSVEKKANVALAKVTQARAVHIVPPEEAAGPKPSDADVRATAEVVQGLSEQTRTLEQAVGAIAHDIAVREKALAQQAVQAQRLAVLEADAVKAQDELDGLTVRAQALAFWVEGFGKSGLKSFLLECELAEINALATKYAQRLLGTGAKIQLSATRKLKTKDTVREELSVDAEIPGCTYRYAGASKGQKRRLDLALLLALRDVASARSNVRVDQFFADEVFDGVDKAGCETVGLLLQELSTQYPITLITHTNALKSIATRVVRVVHNGTSASLVAA